MIRRLAPLLFLLVASCGEPDRFVGEVERLDRTHLLTVTDLLHARPTWRGVKPMRRVALSPAAGGLSLRPRRVHAWGDSYDQKGKQIGWYSGIHRAAQAVTIREILPFWAASHAGPDGRIQAGYPSPGGEICIPEDTGLAPPRPKPLDDAIAFALFRVPDEILLAVMHHGVGEWATGDERKVEAGFLDGPPGTLSLACLSREWYVMLRIEATWERPLDESFTASWRAEGFVRLRADGAIQGANLEVDVSVAEEGTERARARHLVGARYPNEGEALREVDALASLVALHAAEDEEALDAAILEATSARARQMLTLLRPNTDWAAVPVRPDPAIGDLRRIAHDLSHAAALGRLDLETLDADALAAAKVLAQAEAEITSWAVLLAMDTPSKLSDLAFRYADLPEERDESLDRAATRWLGRQHRFPADLDTWMRAAWETYPYRTDVLRR